MEPIKTYTVRERVAANKCKDYKYMIREHGFLGDNSGHTLECTECNNWWKDQVMIYAFQRNQNNHEKRIKK